ncbi:MAG: hypothetical protein GQ527_07230 [Bacteroidales bacterium]|nr:hypothetical protein [Bacteroidales bacterium]
MANKYLYENFNKDKRIYNLNQGYWKNKFKSKIEKTFFQENVLFKNIDKRGNKIYDANPIFTFLNSKKTKAIRIIQDDISNVMIDQIEANNSLISAWVDNIRLYSSDYKENEILVKELVIALFLTKETVEKTMNLITKWLREDLDDEEIAQILNINT